MPSWRCRSVAPSGIGSAGPGSSVLLGRDTRRSGEMLSAALAAGLTSTGTDAVDLGVVTTPCLVHASLEARHAAGIMVSASHNPAPDNGLKVVVAGRKADDAIETELDALIDDPSPIPPRPNEELGRIRADRDAVEAYARHLREIAGDAFEGLRLGIDCANGSASDIAPDLFRSLGARGDRAVRRPERDEHQRRMRIDPSGATGGDGRRGRPRDRLRLRWRRGSAHRGRRARRARGRRCGDGDLRAGAAGGGHAPEQRPGRDRHEQRRPRAGRHERREARWSGPRSETATSSRRWSARTRCWAASSPATSSSETDRRRATACSPASSSSSPSGPPACRSPSSSPAFRGCRRW